MRILCPDYDDPRIRNMRRSEHLGFLQALVCVHSQTHNVTRFVVIAAVAGGVSSGMSS